MAQVLKDKCKIAIIDAAKKEFLENGYKDASMRTIASKANMTVGNLYRYFKNKEDIMSYIVNETLEKIDEVIKKASKNNLSLETRVFSAKYDPNQIRNIFNELGDGLVEIYAENKTEFNILIKHSNLRDKIVEWLTDLLDEIIYQTYHVEIYRYEIKVMAKTYAISMFEGLANIFSNTDMDIKMLNKLVEVYFNSYIYMFDGDMNKIIGG